MRLPSIAIALITLLSVLALPLPECKRIALQLNNFFSLPVLAQTAQERKAEADQLFDAGFEQAVKGELRAAIASWQQALNLYREIGDRTREGETLSNLGAAYLSSDEYATSIEYLQQSLTIARETGARGGEGLILSNLGSAYRNLGEYEQAIESLQQSLTIAQSLGNRTGEAAVLNNLANVYQNLGEYAKSIEYSQQSLAIARSLDNRAGERRVLNNLADTYNSLSDPTTAIEYAQQSLSIARDLGDRAGVAAALMNLGLAYNGLADYTTAIDYHQQALAIAREIGDRSSEQVALSNLGNNYSGLGDYDTAIDYHQQNLVIAREIGDRAGVAGALNNLGNVYRNQGDYATAINYTQQGLAIARAIGDRRLEATALGNLSVAYDALGNDSQFIEYTQQVLFIAREIGNGDLEAKSLGNLAVRYRDLGEYNKALEYEQQSLEIFRKIGDRAGEGVSLGNLGIIYFFLGDEAKGIEQIQQYLNIAREIGDRASEAKALSYLGGTDYFLEEYATAIQYYQQSLAINREVGDRAAEGMTLNNLGSTFLSNAQLTEAETTLRQGIEVWESIREKLGKNDDWKVSIFEEQASTYRLLQRVLIAQNRFAEALEISERGRARAFVDLMAQRLEKNSEIAVKLEAPNLAQIKQVSQEKNAVLVEYSLTSKHTLYIWVIQPSGDITFRSVDLTQGETPLSELAERGRITAASDRLRGIDHQTDTLLSEMVRGTRDSLSNATVATQTSTVPRRINRNLQQLHQLLIEPIADLLPSDPNQKVIFIPQGSLFLVPFSALQDSNGTYLIEKHTILTAPAIQVLELTQQQPMNESGEILIVGNPTMPKVSLAPHQPPQQLTPLPGTETEANAIASLLNVQTLIGDRATETLIKQKMPQAKLIHLATHGLLEETSNGLLAAIALTPSSNDDGLLTPEEILALDLNADLVVLSACDTGRGKVTGDGVVGLARSILTAGSRSTIVSLWKVPDFQTSGLMSEFYRQWQQSGDKAQALRQAMLITMQQHLHPMNWAAFTIMGEFN